MVNGIINRFEGKIAVVEIDGGVMKDIPKNSLPKETRVGDILFIEGVNFTISKKGTERLRKEINVFMEELFE